MSGILLGTQPPMTISYLRKKHPQFEWVTVRRGVGCRDYKGVRGDEVVKVQLRGAGYCAAWYVGQQTYEEWASGT